MAEDTQQAQKEPVSETQDAPMPSAEQKTSDDQIQGEGADIQESSQETDADTSREAKIAAHNAQEFERLRDQLRDERVRREMLEASFQSMQPKAEVAQPAPIYDPDTGLLNEQVFTDVQRRSIEAEQRANKAEAAIQSLRLEQEERETFTVHPELNPNDQSFNKDLHIATRRILLDSQLNPNDYGGRQLSFKQAADLAKGVTNDPKIIEKAKKEGAQEALEQLTPKEQASLEATGSVGVRGSGVPMEDLQRRSRKGDLDAIVQRLNTTVRQE